MDTKKISEFFSQHGFWALCGTVVAATVGCWIWASGNLDKETETQRRKHDDWFSQIGTLMREPNHPNKFSHAEMDRLNSLREQQIYDAWKRHSDHQNEVLEWPAVFAQQHPEHFEEVIKMRPIEKHDGNIHPNFLATYREHVTQELPQLAQSIGAEWDVKTGAESQVPGDAIAGPDSVGSAAESENNGALVVWNKNDQRSLWQTHFSWPEKPTTKQMLYAQETLWVLGSVMRVIKRTNEGATARYNASVKTIDSIRLGKSVRGLSGRVSRPAGVSAPPETIDTEAPKQDADPADNRYVGLDYRPLPVASLKTAMDLKDKESAKLAVAKRMPIEMRIVIDQSKINQFLVSCGNAKLPIEVRQVRINPKGRGATPAFSEVGADVGPGGVGHDPTGAGGGIARSRSATTKNDVTLQIYGIVYIYNPADGTFDHRNNPGNTANATTIRPPTG